MAITLDTWAEIHRHLRRSKDWSQHKAAMEIGVHYGTIQSWESGKKEPNLRQIQLCAAAYGVQVWSLLRSSDKRALFNGSIPSGLRIGDLLSVPA